MVVEGARPERTVDWAAGLTGLFTAEDVDNTVFKYLVALWQGSSSFS